MPKKVIIIFFLVALFQVAFGQTISEIQQTTVAGDDGTYPSTMLGQEVTISPVTIAGKGFNGSDNNLFAFDLNPGIWNGIYLNNANGVINEYAMVSITGTVAENNGMTELVNPTISQLNPGPYGVTANLITIPNVNDHIIAEQYESSYVKINNLVYSGNNEGDYWLVEDGDENIVRIGSGLYTANPEVGDEFGSISGILVYDGNNFVIHPMNEGDIVASTPATLTVASEYEKIGSKLYVHVSSSNIKDYWGLTGFSFNFTFADEFLAYHSNEVALEGIGEPMPIADESNEDGIYTINFDPGVEFPSYNSPILVTLIFDIKEYGVASVNFSNFSFSDNNSNTWNISDLSNLNVSFNNTYNDKDAYLSIRNARNDKNIFNPYQNDRLTIKYGFKPGYSTKTIVRIYDLKGRLIYTPVNKVHSGLGEFIWDGRDKNRELVDIGTYICQVEVVIRENGDKYITDQPIVVAGQLK